MQSNLPAGADNSPIAPWNQVDDLCKYCDRDIIRGMAQEATPDDADTEEHFDAMLDEAGLCRECQKEQDADDHDDWCNWNS